MGKKFILEYLILCFSPVCYVSKIKNLFHFLIWVSCSSRTLTFLSTHRTSTPLNFNIKIFWLKFWYLPIGFVKANNVFSPSISWHCCCLYFVYFLFQSALMNKIVLPSSIKSMPQFSWVTLYSIGYTNISEPTFSNVLAGHASGCWRSALGAGVHTIEKKTKV